MLPYEICKLPVFSVELDNAYPVLDFLRGIRWEEVLHHRQIVSLQ